MELLCKWNQLSLVKRILIGLILGAVLGFLLPGASFLSLLGTLFVGAEGPGPPACLFPGLALPGTAQERGQEQHEHRHRALPHRHPSGCAVCGGCQLSVSLHPGAGPGGGLQRPRRHRRDPPDPAQQLGEQPHLRMAAEANYIGVLLWAVVFGIALRDASDRTKQVLGDLSDALSTAIRWVISCAPFGILGLVFTTVSRPASPPSWTTAACSVSWRAACSSWP